MEISKKYLKISSTTIQIMNQIRNQVLVKLDIDRIKKLVPNFKL